MEKKGFTLIELLVVMTIMAILFALALVSYQGARKAARDGKRKVDLEEIRGALEMCRTDSGSYPSNALLSGADIVCDLINYMTIPFDPTGNDYTYNPSGDDYSLCTTLEVGGNFCVASP